MSRLLRSQPPQSRLGKPTALAPVVTTLSINLATGVLTNQRRAQQRRTEQVRWQPQRRVLAATGIGNDSPATGVAISTSGTQYAQQFTVGQAVRLADVQLVLGLNLSPTDSVTFELHADSGGTPDVPVLASATIRARDFASGSGGLFSIPLGVTLAAGSYWVVLARTGATDASNDILWYDIGGPTLNPATTARNTGSGWVTGTFSRALTLLTQLVYDDISGQLPMIGVKPPTQVSTVAPFAPIQVNQAQGWLVNQRRAQQRRTTSFFVKTPPVRVLPVVTTLDVNFAARNREPIKRFPLQGWEGETTQQRGGPSALDSGALKTPFAGTVFGGTGTAQQLAMSLVSPTTVEISRVFAELSRSGNPVDNAVFSIQTDSGGFPSGVVLASDSFLGSALPAGGNRRIVAADLPVTLTAGVTYWVVLSRDGALDAVNAYAVSAPTPDPSVVAASLNSGVWASTLNRFWYLTEGPSFGTPARFLGPKPPLVVGVSPVVTTLSVNLTPSRLSNQWARQRRIATLEPFDSRTLSELTGPPSVNSTGGFGTIVVPTASVQLTPRLDTAYESLTVRLRKSGTPTDNALISIQTDSGGAPSGVKIFTADPISLTTLGSASLSRFTFDLGGLALTGGTPYWVVFERSGALDNSNAPITERSFNAAYAQIWTTTATPQMVFPFGPRPPLIVSALKPVVSTLEVNFAARDREPIRRFPLQGWQEVTVSGSGTIKSGIANHLVGTIGSSVTSEKFASRAQAEKDFAVSSIRLELQRLGSPTDNVIVSIQADAAGVPSGVALASVTIDASTLPAQPTLTVFTLPLSIELAAGQLYWVVYERSGALSATNVARSSGTILPVAPSGGLRFDTGAWVAINGAEWFELVSSPAASYQMVSCNLGPKPPTVVLIAPVAPIEVVAPVAIAKARRVPLTKSLLFPPQTLAQPPPNPPIAVSLAAVRTRNTNTERFPLPGWEGWGAIDALSGFAINNSKNTEQGQRSDGDAAARQAQAQSFIGISGQLDWVQLKLAATGTPSDDLTIEIQTDAALAPSGTVIASATILGSSISTSAVFRVALSCNIVAANRYWIVVRRTGAVDAANFYRVSFGASGTSANWGDFATLNSGVWSLNVGSAFIASLAYEAPAGSRSFYGYKRNLGPWPPLVQNPLPTQQQQTISVRSAKVRRAGPTFSRLSAPAVVATATFVAPPITVSLAAVKTRNTNTRRFPLPGWDGGVTQDGSVAWSPLNVIDYFNRANENPLSNGGRWVRIASGLAVMQIISNVAAGSTSTTSAMAWASLGSVGDSQIACTISTLPAVSGDTVNLYLRIGGINSGLNVETGYLARWQAQTGIVEIFRLNGDNTTTLLATTTIAAPVVGDRLLFQVIGSTMVFSVNQGAAWTAVLAATDATYASGDIGFGGRGTTFRVDDVQGGLLASGSGQQGNPSRNLGPRPPQLITPLPPLVGLAVNCLQPDRLSRRFRRQLPSSVLSPPPIAATFIAPALSVNCLSPDRLSRRFRRQLPTTALQPPTVLRVFAAGRPALVSTRPRPIIHRLAPPTVVRVPSVEQREQTIGVSLARIRPRTTRSLLPQTIVAAAQFTAEPISVTLTRIRPRRTARALFPPTTLQVFSGPTVSRVRIRPHATVHALSVPTVVFIPAVEQQRRTLRTPLARIRPRPTTTFLNPPTVVRVPSVEQQEDTVRVFLVRVRPRHTVATLTEPTVLQTFAGPSVHGARIRPRLTRRFLTPPTVVTVPSVEQAEETIRVTLTRIRPRPTARTLFEPTVLQVFPGTLTPLVHTRPRPTVYRVDPPTVIRVPSVEQQEDTIKVSLARIRPRPTVRLLAAPTALQTFSGPRITLARIRPRPTVRRLYAPTVVIPTPSQRVQTITVTLGGRTRLEMPRRAPVYDLRPPTVIVTNPPVVTEITVSEVEPKNRRDQARRFPNQGQRQRLVRETGTTVTNQLRDPFVGPRPPQIIDPLPGQRTTTISASLVAVRTRREIPRHTVSHVLRPPTAVIPLPTLRAQTVQITRVRIRPRHTFTDLGAPTVVDRTLYAAPETPLVRTRPRKTSSLLGEPTVVRVPAVEAALRTIHVSLVRTRPRPTARTLSAPTALRVFAAGRPALTRIRPRHTISRLGPPTTLKEFFGPAETEVAVSTVPDRRRHLPHSHLGPPTVFAPTVTTIREALTRTRPRPTTTTLSPPTVVADRFAASPIQVSLTPARRPSTRTTLAAPTVIERFVAAPIRVSLAAGRRPAVSVTLSPPTVVAPPAAPVSVTITAALAVAATRRRFRIGRSFFPPVLPPYGPLKLPANTGYAVPASTANGDAIPAGFSDGDARPAAASEGRTLPVAESDGKAVPGTATTEGLK